jgi:hypothetical protein
MGKITEIKKNTGLVIINWNMLFVYVSEINIVVAVI